MEKPVIDALRSWRLGRGFSFAQAARSVGTAPQTWHDWENGRRIPGQQYMTRIYRVTGGTVTANDFYWPTGRPRLSGVEPDNGSSGKSDDPAGYEAAA